MALEIIIATHDPKKDQALTLPSGRELFEVLGPQEQATQTTLISELLGRLFEQIQETINFECNVEVTVSGSLSLTGKADMKYLIFNVGGEAQTQTTMTVKLATKLIPSV